MSLARLPDPRAARAWCAARAEGSTLGFVPTMGALHEGHIGLVRRSVSENERTCVSVFVNPLQFDDPLDLERYPRDLDADAELLEAAGCDMVFTGTLAGFFPEASSPAEIPRREPGPAAVGLEGAFRAGHFAGVATIVARLFALVVPDRAYFGEKDFQQSLVVHRVARELGYPRIEVCPTAREPDGLARSSRNLLLSGEGRRRAVGVSAALFATRRAWRAGERDAATLRARLAEALARGGIEAEYAALRDPERWSASEPTGPLERARALVAARVDGVRLIDTLALDGDDPEPAPEGAARAEP